MNEMNPSTNGFDQRMLDRLVDGELGEGQRRAVLERMEGQPELWRRCALAFLEAQSWRQELTAVRGERTEIVPTPRNVAVVRTTSRRSLASLMILVASFLLAFVLGRASWPLWNGATKAPVADATGNRTKPGDVLSEERKVDGNQRVAVASQGAQEETLPAEFVLPVTYVLDAAELEETQPAPIFSSTQLHELQRMGISLNQQQRLVPLALDGGETMYLPVDDVQFRYVGRPKIQ